MTTKLVLLRHGESQWNKENRFTGWIDIDLSRKGHLEAKKAGKILKNQGYLYHIAYTSVLKRAIHTLWHVLDELDQAWIPVEKSWRLNERHYGALQGCNKNTMIEQYGYDQVRTWRRSFFSIPPKLNQNHQDFPGNDIRYTNLNIEEIPTAESLEMTMNRILPYWNNVIVPNIKYGKHIIVVAHGNSIRAIMKFLDNVHEEEIIELNVPTAIPLVYEFDDNIRPKKHYFINNTGDI